MSVFYCFIASIIQALGGTFIAVKISDLNIKNNMKKILAFYVLNVTYLFISGTLITKNFRFFFSVVILIFIYYITIEKSPKISIIKSFITMLILPVSEILGSCILYIFVNDMNDIGEIWYINIYLVIFVLIFSILITIIFNKSIHKIINVLTKKSVVYFLLFILIIYLMVAKNVLYVKFDFELFINLVILVAIIVLSSFSLVKEIKNNRLNDENKQMINYVTRYEKIITEQGKANHEFKNQLMVISGYAKTNNKKLIEYIDSVIEDTKMSYSTFLISQLNKFPDGGLKGLLYYKLSIMTDEQIKYTMEVQKGIKSKLNNLDIKKYKNITKILGVLLDNAIYASKNSRDKNIIISVSKSNKKVEFIISNTYSGKIDVNKIGTGFTTKGKNHGYGLRLVQDIIDSNDDFSINNSIDDDLYVCTFCIKI